MSIRASAWAWTTQAAPTAKLVLLALADFADESGYCWPRVSVLVGMTGLSERAVRTAITALTAAGLLITDRAVGRGNSSRYILSINLDPEKVREMQVLRDREKVQQVPEKVHLLPEKVHVVPEKVQELHPEPSRTIKNRQEPPKGREAPPSVVLPDWLPSDAWADWCEFRATKPKRAEWTQAAAKTCLRTLDRLQAEGNDLRLVIDQSIAAGWPGLYPVKAQRPAPQREGKLDWLKRDIMGDVA